MSFWTWLHCKFAGHDWTTQPFPWRVWRRMTIRRLRKWKRGQRRPNLPDREHTFCRRCGAKLIRRRAIS